MAGRTAPEGANPIEKSESDAAGEVSGEVGAERRFGTVINQIPWTPVSPLGQDSTTVELQMRSRHGPT